MRAVAANALQAAVTAALMGAVLLAPPLRAAGARAAEACPNAAVRAEQGVQEGAAHSLPGCRAYELASPPQKNEQEVNPPDRFVREVSFQAAEQGGGIEYTLTGAIPGSASGGLYSAALSRSSGAGASWEAFPLEPDNYLEGLHSHGEVAGEFESFSPTLGCGVESTRLPLPPFNGDEAPQLAPGESAGEDIDNLYDWNAPDEYTLITNVKPSDPAEQAEEPAYYVDGASADCKTVLFSSSLAAGYSLPGAPVDSIYEWDEGESPAACRADIESCEPRVASVLPDGKDATTVVDPDGGEYLSDLGELSASGARMFFTASSDGGEPSESADAGAEQIYLREDGTTLRAISLSQTASPVRDTGAKFEAASREGERVFFAANYGLTGTDSAHEGKPCLFVSVNKEFDEGNGAGSGCDLYEYDVGDGHLDDISSDPGDANGADARGVLGIAADGSAVYFSATGQLVPGIGNTEAENEATTGQTRAGTTKTEAEANVYGYYEGALHYIATIGEAEAGGFNPGTVPFLEVDAISGTKGMHYYMARVAQNGRYLLLATRHRITAYDNTRTAAGTPEWEEYEFSRATGAVNCVSCNPTGEAPQPDEHEQFSPLGIYVAVQDGVVPANLADDGRAFFDSFQPLQASGGGTSFTPANKTVNVYEWAPEGAGGCVPPAPASGRPALHGCLGLLDSGTDPFPSYFEGASVDGENAYLTTHAALAAQDRDGLDDIYDVRVAGGIAAPPGPPECSQNLSSCQPPGSGIAAVSAASESSAGGGNVASPPPGPAGGGGAAIGVQAYVRRTVKGTSVAVTVDAAAAGRITASGKGFKTARTSAPKAASYRLTVALTAAERRLLRRRHKVKLTLRILFAPSSGGSPVSTSAPITFI